NEDGLGGVMCFIVINGKVDVGMVVGIMEVLIVDELIMVMFVVVFMFMKFRFECVGIIGFGFGLIIYILFGSL
ncbi:hypothetical protein GUG22_02080, partial [Xanthomonas citri pv. citri]|nr:hypothetical protein [Xanthomonas citri pv. citri]